MPQHSRQRFFILFVALLNLGLATALIANGHAGLPLGVIGIALLPLAWLAGRNPAAATDTQRGGDSYAA
ncbi:hypothetical protein [uncultured Alcanivorax sp.]|uniref:hypothetical protein n=1 Tax=uncultured Alcanivorax sp. TaxID=191215 RepID=UPI0026313DCD|nr:hypothetical protein [uncultured Alcanivorax sp.]